MTTVSEPPTQGDPYPRREPPESHTGQQPTTPSPDDTGGIAYAWQAYPAVRAAVVVLCLAVAALVVWLAFLRSDGESAIAEPGGGPVASSQADLAALSVRLGQPIYWAGTSGTQLEATVTTNNYVYVRYLTPDAQVGDSLPQFLTVATYPATNALGNLRSYANHEDAQVTHIPGGGIAVPVPGAPTSVYFAGPGADYQVEVFDPDEGAALDLIRSGTIVPVSGGVDPSAGGPAGSVG